MFWTEKQNPQSLSLFGCRQAIVAKQSNSFGNEFGLLPLRETTDDVCFWRLSNIIDDNDNSGGGEKALVAV